MVLAPFGGVGQFLAPDGDQPEHVLALRPEHDVKSTDIQEALRRLLIDIGPVEEKQVAPFESILALSNLAPRRPIGAGSASTLLRRDTPRPTLAAHRILAGHVISRDSLDTEGFQFH